MDTPPPCGTGHRPQHERHSSPPSGRAHRPSAATAKPAPAATNVKQMIMELLTAFQWHQLRPGAWRAWLPTLLAATALSFWRRLESLAVVAGRWFRPGARVAGDALRQAGQLGGQGGELLTHLLIHLTQRPISSRYSRISFCVARMNTLESAGNVNQSASEIPEGGADIASSPLPGCNRESCDRQGLAKTKSPFRLSQPLNGLKSGHQMQRITRQGYAKE